MKTLKTLLSIGVLLSFGAFAQNVVTAVNAQQVTDILATNGYKFSLDAEDDAPRCSN
ncbi:hypothetical protein [Oceanithermus sp.]